MHCPEANCVIEAYGDDELASSDAAEVHAHLDACLVCKQRVAARASLGRLIRRVRYYAAPDRLRIAVAIARRPVRVSPQLLAWAAMVTVVVSLGSGAMIHTVGARQTAAATTTMARDVVAGHVRALIGAHLLDVRSTDQHTVKPWFLGKLDFSPQVDDLAPLGFPLVGGRLDYLAGRPVAALVYQRQQHTIHLFEWPASDTREALTDTRALRGFQVRHWTRDGMALWAVSDLSEIELDQFCQALHQ